MTTCDDDTRPAFAGQVNSPFVQIALEVLYSGISAEELQLYAVLLDKGWKTGHTPATNAEIGTLIGKSAVAVKRDLKKLIDRGLVVRSDVPPTEQCPSGRLLTVNGRVRGRIKNDPGGRSKMIHPPGSKMIHSSNTNKEKKYGPLTPGTGAAPEQTIEDRLAEARKQAEYLAGDALSRFPGFKAAADREVAELERTLAAKHA